MKLHTSKTRDQSRTVGSSTLAHQTSESVRRRQHEVDYAPDKSIFAWNHSSAQHIPTDQNIEDLISDKRRFFPAFIMTLIMLIGAYVRLEPTLASDFPLNDGGLFYIMIQEIQQANHHIPWTTSYNGTNIPFAYPPLALELTALFVRITATPLIDAMRLLPAIISTATIPVFYLLSNSILKHKGQALFATLSFAMLPEMFHTFIKGGGITRSPGFLFAFAAIYAAHHMYTQHTKLSIFLTSLFSALTILTHPSAALFAATSIAIIFLSHDRTKIGLLHSSIVVTLCILLTSPWWITIIYRHGWSVFIEASHLATGSWFWRLNIVALQFTHEPLVQIVNLLAVVGFLVCLANRQFLLPVWLIVLYCIDYRYNMVYIAAPVAMLNARGLIVLLAGIEQSFTSLRDNTSIIIQKRDLQFFFVGLISIYIISNAILFEKVSLSTLAPLTIQDRRDLQWIADHTTDSSQFIIISGATSPGADPLSEWFPALTGRSSLTTIQGSEWQQTQHFSDLEKLYAQLQACYYQSVDCLAAWKQRSQTTYTHIYVTKGNSAHRYSLLLSSLQESSLYRLVYKSDNASIFECQ